MRHTITHRLAGWFEQACERLDERVCALSNLTDDGEEDSAPTTLSPVLGRRLA